MDVLKDALALLRRLAGSMQASTTPAGATPTTSESPGEPGEPDEFADLLAEVGAQAPPADEAFSLERLAASELRRNLEALQPLGDRLAETEKQRLAYAARVADLERNAASLLAELASAEILRAEVDRLRRELAALRAAREEERAEATRVVAGLRDELLSAASAQSDDGDRAAELRACRARIRRLEKSLAAARRKRDERDRVATERWHELRRLRSERKQAERRIARLERLAGKKADGDTQAA